MRTSSPASKLSLIPPASTTRASSPSSSRQRIAALRNEAACVRTLLDEIERLVPHSHEDDARTTDSMRTQLIEQLTRLGCTVLETAADLAEEQTDQEIANELSPNEPSKRTDTMRCA